MHKVLFEETLRFRQPQLWIPLLFIFAGSLAIQVYFLIISSGKNPIALMLVFAVSLLILGSAAIFLYISRLDTRLTSSGLQVRFYPLERSFCNIGWKDMKQVRAAIVRPLQDFGGWGLRYARNSKAYILTGSKCIEFKLSDDSLLYVNTLEPEKFLSCLAFGNEVASPKDEVFTRNF